MVFSNILEVIVSKIIRLSSVIDQTGLSRSSIYKFIQDESFPKQIPLGERAVGWVKSEVDDWIAARIDKSRKLVAVDKQTELNDEV